MSPWTESHSDLEKIFRLHDDKRDNRAKVEFSPPSMATADKPETYVLRIDEKRTPDWFGTEMQEAVSAKMAEYIKAITVSGSADLLIGGQFIVAKGARIGCVKTCVIVAVLGDAKISGVRGSATISDVWGSATISDVGDSATISSVWGSAKISDVRDSAKISGVRGSAAISDVWGSATISDVRDSATISDVGDSAKISGVWDSATISGVWGSAAIENDQRATK